MNYFFILKFNGHKWIGSWKLNFTILLRRKSNIIALKKSSKNEKKKPDSQPEMLKNSHKLRNVPDCRKNFVMRDLLVDSIVFLPSDWMIWSWNIHKNTNTWRKELHLFFEWRKYFLRDGAVNNIVECIVRSLWIFLGAKSSIFFVLIF